MAGGRDACSSKRGTCKDVLGIAIPPQTSCPSHQHHGAVHICFLLNCLWSTSTTAFCKVEICTPTADVLNPVSPCLGSVLSLNGSFTPIGYLSFFFFPLATPFGMRGLSSLTRDQTHAPWSGIMELPGNSLHQQFDLRYITFFVFFLIFILYCSIVDLQCCISFIYTTKWFSYTYTCIYSFSDAL